MTKKILLVEDEAILAMAEAKIIQKHGFEVLTAHKGEKAIELIENDPGVSLVLMDIDLGKGIDGTQAAQEILNKRTLPIVFLTSHSEEEYVKRVKKITNYGYVLKNSGEFVLIESINMAYNLFNAHKKTRESEEKYKAAFMTSPDSVNINRLDGLYVDINEGFTVLTGFTRDDVISKTSYEIDIWAIPEDREKLVQSLKENGYVENLESSFRCKDGSLKTALMSARLITLNDEPHILSITRDITKYRENEVQLREYTKRLELTMQGANIAWWEMDVKTGNVSFNRQKTDILGYRKEDFTHYLDFMNIVHPDDYQKTIQAMRAHFEGKEKRYDTEYRIKTSSGQYKWFHDYGSITERDSDNSPKKVSGIVIDITDNKETEVSLKKSKKNLELILDNIPEDIYIADVETYEILLMNEQMKKSFPYAHEGEICYEAFRGYTSPCGLCSNDKLFDEHGDTKEAIVWEGKNPLNGNWYINYDKGIPWFNGRKVRLQIAADITERKIIESQLQKQKLDYELIFNNSMDGILFTSPDGAIYSANPAACEILQTTEEELVEKGREGLVDTEDPRLAKAIEERSKYGSFRGELRLKKRNGEKIPVELTSRVFNNSDGEQRTCILFRDISEQKQREQELLDAVKEKDFLMKELNHRVKNNLYMISSLINMKADEAGKEVDLHSIINHIEAIRLVHDQLHSKENISNVNFKDYSRELLKTIFSNFARREVEIVDRVEALHLSSRTIVPLGLIINEIATNAIKHGFNGDEISRFTIELAEDNTTSQYILTLSNTGGPFPQKIDLENPTTLGLQLITSLVKQIDGTINLQKSPYPVFTIRFPV